MYLGGGDIRIRKVMGRPDPLEFSKDSEIFHHEKLHPHERLSSRSIIHFSIWNDLERRDGSLGADTDADVWRDSPLRKIRG